MDSLEETVPTIARIENRKHDCSPNASAKLLLCTPVRDEWDAPRSTDAGSLSEQDLKVDKLFKELVECSRGHSKVFQGMGILRSLIMPKNADGPSYVEDSLAALVKARPLKNGILIPSTASGTCRNCSVPVAFPPKQLSLKFVFYLV